jgi:hypothetical protein
MGAGTVMHLSQIVASPVLLWRPETRRNELPARQQFCGREFFMPLASAPLLQLDVPGAREMSERKSGWSRQFAEPIALPDGGKLIVLRNADDYITALPAKEAALPERQAAIEALMLVAELGGPTMFARIGVMRALHRHVERVFDPDRKDHHWGKRKLKRDQ